MDATIWLSIGSTIVSTGVGGYAFKAAIRLEVLERLFEEKRTTIDTVKTSQDTMDKRLTRVEDAIIGFSDVLPELRKLGKLADKLELLNERQESKIHRLEDLVLLPKE